MNWEHRIWFSFGIVVGLSASVAPRPELRLILAGIACVTLVTALIWQDA